MGIMIILNRTILALKSSFTGYAFGIKKLIESKKPIIDAERKLREFERKCNL